MCVIVIHKLITIHNKGIIMTLDEFVTVKQSFREFLHVSLPHGGTFWTSP